jgi:hypothetical protein
VHVDDLVDALVTLVEAPPRAGKRCIALVGPQAMTLPAYLDALAAALGRTPPIVLVVPRPAAHLAARLGGHRWLSSESLELLDAGAIADPGATSALLGRTPRPPLAFIDDRERTGVCLQAVLGWALPLLRLALGLVWIVTGLLSFGLYPVDASRALLAAVGVPPLLQMPMLHGAAALDLLLGVLTLAAPSRPLWRIQAALMLFYMVVIALKLPEYWLHPFGPLLKNLPMLACLLLLDALAARAARRER